MCGIAGYFNKSGVPVHSTDTVLKMLALQKHRGPDDSGVRAFSLRSQNSREYATEIPSSVDESLEGIVGFNRLSIVDLSANGHQPMCTEDEKVFVAFNGEIYNAFDFTNELQNDGYRFKSSSDTEVILALYLKYGFDGMITRLNGMFAIVLIDTTRQTMFIARDRFGIKPIYLFETNEFVAFSSEVKSFMAFPAFRPQLHESLLDEFLLFRNTGNKTLFRGIEGVEPGTYKIYSPESVQTKRYFSIDSYARVNDSYSAESPQSLVQYYLEAGVKRQLMSDVKLGCQLSGGIDSSLVTYYANKIKSSSDHLETISIVFSNDLFNEESYVNNVTDALKIRAHKFRLEADYFWKNFEQATWHFEAPINHPNTLGIYFLSQEAKKYVTVLLSGEGADEVFGGYDRFAALNHPFQLRTFLSSLKRNRTNPIEHVRAYFSSDYRAIMASAYMTTGLARLVMPDFDLNQSIASRKEIYNNLRGSHFDKQIKYEITTYLPDLLLRQDKMSMAHSIENRVPFLDNDLVEKSFQIPMQQLLRKHNGKEQLKMPLKQLSQTIFGENFTYRKKSGFGIPLRDFFSDKMFADFVMDDLRPSVSGRGLFNKSSIEKWIKEIHTISSEELDALWIMVSFEAWAKRFKV